jgi:hypothetical protein
MNKESMKILITTQRDFVAQRFDLAVEVLQKAIAGKLQSGDMLPLTRSNLSL